MEKKIFAPPDRKSWLRKRHYKTPEEKKKLADFAKAAKEHFETRVKINRNKTV